jgi:hypothetical protein
LATHITAIENGAIDGSALVIRKSVLQALVFHKFPLWKSGGCRSVQPYLISWPVF